MDLEASFHRRERSTTDSSPFCDKLFSALPESRINILEANPELRKHRRLWRSQDTHNMAALGSLIYGEPNL